MHTQQPTWRRMFTLRPVCNLSLTLLKPGLRSTWSSSNSLNYMLARWLKLVSTGISTQRLSSGPSLIAAPDQPQPRSQRVPTFGFFSSMSRLYATGAASWLVGFPPSHTPRTTSAVLEVFFAWAYSATVNRMVTWVEIMRRRGRSVFAGGKCKEQNISVYYASNRRFPHIFR